MSRLVDSRRQDRRHRNLVSEASGLVVAGFDDYNASFSDITRRGQRRFEKGDRAGMRTDVVARLELYDQIVNETISRLEGLLANRLFSRSIWRDMRVVFASLIKRKLDAELYKTFFNTITRRLFKTRGVDSAIEFVAFDFQPSDRITHPVARYTYIVGERLADAFGRILDDYAFGLPWVDAERDAGRLAGRMEQVLEGDEALSIELLETVFYREGRAYLVGRVLGRTRHVPCVIALCRRDNAIAVDALLTRRLQLSILFGYTYSYFLADLPTVADAVVFLRSLLPDKPVDELYSVLGRAKQGKTERYRAFRRYMSDHPDERFEVAEGKRGMVMAVFTLPGYPLVFKLLRDKFAPEKTIKRHQVIERYQLVYRHDRVGRLLDVQEFKSLRFERDRFAPELLEELLEECSRIVRVDGDDLVIRHCYVERRVRPLDLYLSEVEVGGAKQVLVDMGQALKDLARSNIFAGDLLPKNFGVTRSGRVVFYDYDELALLTDCRFRRMPKARDDIDIYSDETWFHVADNDVFPEEFPRFMALRRDYLEVLEEAHGELFEAEWWQGIQERIVSGEALDVPPYGEEARLS
ncbi:MULTISPECIES: bifunctional isocitrate dehydrogenase kinase/phosphatase [unclassified Wenzhouxiangella]|uniref:bifunctional isocitrate dehydrogenase kinase/phosphatase n=1 Tax=unclassified Wenzhouxiangella TaxID=2613841 RepID=UPI000E32C01A|nr:MULTISPECIES: bifunctional isocitrate dehydrogenase kinase/phosphatase [unclassified Wenzhouxiangella]RFF28248.1 bifunctional isocitrate dehydrogenase kinase/phosphatase [Wenzhouxiangella sp. 15181]RFP69394.1 bifunctional isocitrate dehydrogenase kinase/phosphatase [Wenzhouxiangella sp. 15190]